MRQILTEVDSELLLPSVVEDDEWWDEAQEQVEGKSQLKLAEDLQVTGAG